MTKIYRYELRYVLFNKLFIGFSALLFLFSYYLLNKTLILGTSYTAPFSIYSYANYCLMLCPILLIGESALNHLYFTQQHQKRLILFERCAIKKTSLQRINLCVLLSAVIIWIFIILFSAMTFYFLTFHQFAPITYTALAFFLLLPPAVFYLYFNYRLSDTNIYLAYLFCICLILISQIPLEINPLSPTYFILTPLSIPLDTTQPFPFIQWFTRFILLFIPIFIEFLLKKSKTS